ncbi:hypothetical protein GCM10009112_29000 [Marinomonas arenicola]
MKPKPLVSLKNFTVPVTTSDMSVFPVGKLIYTQMSSSCVVVLKKLGITYDLTGPNILDVVFATLDINIANSFKRN